MGMLVWLTLYRAVTPHNESGSAPIKLYSGGRSDPLAMSLEAIYALARESTRLGFADLGLIHAEPRFLKKLCPVLPAYPARSTLWP